MRDVLDALRTEEAALAARLRRCDAADWSRPTPCEGWDVADVVLHLTQTNELAIASADGRFPELIARWARDGGPGGTVDDAADRRVAHERGLPESELLARWQRSVDGMLDAFDRGDPHTRVVWVAGELSLHTLTTTRLAETWIHHGDVAAAFGEMLEPTAALRHIARLAWRTLPYAFERADTPLRGPVAFELTGPDREPWTFAPGTPAVTTIRGDALDLCLVAARRRTPDDTSLTGDGPDADRVLELVRTYA
jgi:uncharacterized protein (TIGR03084 family)